MTTHVFTEAQLHQAIEQLRQQHSNTLDLYKAVAALLFFRYDTTPTTNRMYQLVRKGSMGTPAEALKLFWNELRERSQVRMEQADIPAALTQGAGLLVAQLWEDGLQLARQENEAANQKLYAQLAYWQTQQAESKSQAQTHQDALLIAQQQLVAADEKEQLLHTQLQQQQIELATQNNLIEQLKQQQAQTTEDYHQQLDAEKQQRLLSEQRAAEMEKYARLEIEQARQQSLKQVEQIQRQQQKQQQKHEQLEQQYQELLTTHIKLQQTATHQAEQLQHNLQQQQQLETKNQDLHTLLHQLQQRLNVLAAPTTTKRPATPSRLAKLKAHKR